MTNQELTKIIDIVDVLYNKAKVMSMRRADVMDAIMQAKYEIRKAVERIEPLGMAYWENEVFFCIDSYHAEIPHGMSKHDIATSVAHRILYEDDSLWDYINTKIMDYIHDEIEGNCIGETDGED